LAGARISTSSTRQRGVTLLSPDDWVPLAEVARPHGVRGEVRLKLFNEDSEVLLGRDEVLVRLPDGEEHEVSVDRARRADGAILMKLFSIDDRDRADELRGAHICVQRREFPLLDEGEFYVCDAKGTRVVCEGREVGTVKDVSHYPTVDVLVVSAADGGKDWEVPLIDVFVDSLDLGSGEIALKTLDGLERG
jgi:16S rRNA processing protein RimM